MVYRFKGQKQHKDTKHSDCTEVMLAMTTCTAPNTMKSTKVNEEYKGQTYYSLVNQLSQVDYDWAALLPNHLENTKQKVGNIRKEKSRETRALLHSMIILVGDNSMPTPDLCTSVPRYNRDEMEKVTDQGSDSLFAIAVILSLSLSLSFFLSLSLSPPLSLSPLPSPLPLYLLCLSQHESYLLTLKPSTNKHTCQKSLTVPSRGPWVAIYIGLGPRSHCTQHKQNLITQDLWHKSSANT